MDPAQRRENEAKAARSKALSELAARRARHSVRSVPGSASSSTSASHAASNSSTGNGERKTTATKRRAPPKPSASRTLPSLLARRPSSLSFTVKKRKASKASSLSVSLGGAPPAPWTPLRGSVSVAGPSATAGLGPSSSSSAAHGPANLTLSPPDGSTPMWRVTWGSVILSFEDKSAAEGYLAMITDVSPCLSGEEREQAKVALQEQQRAGILRRAKEQLCSSDNLSALYMFLEEADACAQGCGGDCDGYHACIGPAHEELVSPVQRDPSSVLSDVFPERCVPTAVRRCLWGVAVSDLCG